MATSTSDAKTYKFLGGGDGQNVGLGMVFNLLKEKISGLGIEGIKSTVEGLESDVNTLQENVGLRDDAINEHGKILDSLTKPTYTTYAKLKELVIGKKLNILSTYILTDYLPVLSSTYSQTTQSVDKSQFALMLIANTNSTFFHECLAVKLTSNQNSIESVYGLKILYDFNNDEGKYDWIDESGGKGVIYRMIDEYGNDCPYDFYNIMFKFGGTYYYTFSGNTGDDIYFTPERFTNCHIEPVYENHTMTLPRNCMSIADHTMPYNIHDIHIKGTNNRINTANYVYECNNIEIQSDGVNIDTLEGSKAVNCENISIGVGCTFSDATISGSNIKIGNNCRLTNSDPAITCLVTGSDITIGNGCDIATTPITGSDITIGNNCLFEGVYITGSNIKIGNGYVLSSGHISGSNIKIGNKIDQDSYIVALTIDGTNINIGSDCTFDPGIQIGSSEKPSSNVEIGNNCSVKSSDFDDNTYIIQITGSNIKIGDNFTKMKSIIGDNIKIGDKCSGIQIGSSEKPGSNVTIGNNCSNIKIGSSDYPSSNITIGNNCQANLIMGEFIRLEDGVVLNYFKDLSNNTTAFPLYNVSFKSGNGVTPITLQLENGFSISENIKIGNCVFYLGTHYDLATGAVDNNKDPYPFSKNEFWGDNKNYIKMVYPDGAGWITEVKK